jgi:hypothetical protein
MGISPPWRGTGGSSSWLVGAATQGAARVGRRPWGRQDGEIAGRSDLGRGAELGYRQLGPQAQRGGPPGYAECGVASGAIVTARRTARGRGTRVTPLAQPSPGLQGREVGQRGGQRGRSP